MPISEVSAELFNREMEQLKGFVHQNIIILCGEGMHNGKKCLVFEYADNGTLEELLYRKLYRFTLGVA